MTEKIRVGALISGGGTNLQAIIDACAQGRIAAVMVFVGSDNPKAKGLQRAEKAGIPTFVVDYGAIIREYKQSPDAAPLPDDFDLDETAAKQSFFPKNADPQKVKTFLHTRAIAEAKLLAHMAAYPFDLLVLAGFMRNMTPYFIDRVNEKNDLPRIMNIHPAILPAFPGVDGYGDTFRYGCKLGGCTVHFIDYGEDSGPIIGQKAFEINSSDTLDDIKKRGLELEWQLFPACIDLYARGRLKLEKKTFTLDSGKAYHRTVVVSI